MKYILIINICTHKLHYYEFVKPIEDIIKDFGLSYSTKHCTELADIDWAEVSKIIICGTSLKDFEYMKHLKKFDFIKNIKQPILGICAGMQIICMAYGCKLTKGIDIGTTHLKLNGLFGIDEEREVYSLHNMIIKDDEVLRKDFKVWGKTGYIQAVGHKMKQQYGLMFHPETRNRDIIEVFLNM